MSDMLGIGSSAVAAYQRALGTVSNNIANIGTEGYVRQETSMAENMPRQQGKIYLGTGVSVAGVRRAYDQFLEQNLRNSTSEVNTQSPMVDYANRVVDIMGSDTVGLPPALDKFFGTARQLSVDPASTIMRAQFLRDADGLASRFRELSTQLQGVDTETRESISSKVAEINTLAGQIATVNKQLSGKPTELRQPPDLLDQRDLLLTKLSALVKISVSTAVNGSVGVSIGNINGSGVLVDKDKAVTLAAVFDEKDLSRVALISDPYGKNPEEVVGISSGLLGGLIGFREQILQPTVSALDFLASTVANELNAIHTNGIDMRGAQGQALFTIDQTAKTNRITGETEYIDQAAAGIRVRLDDPAQVATGSLFRVIEDEKNLSGVDATLTYTPSFAEQIKPLSAVIKNNSHPSAGIVPRPGESIGQIPIGAENWSLYLDGATDLQNIQVMTRDGRHLMGAGLQSQEEQDALLTKENGFSSGSSYSAQYLNKSGEYGYKQVELFYGAQAKPGSSYTYSATFTPSHAALSSYLFTNAQAGKAVPPGLERVDSGTLKINGHELPLLLPTSPATTLQASDFAEWISNATMADEPAVIASASTEVTLAIEDVTDGMYINGYALPMDDTRADVNALRDYININMVSTAKVVAEVDTDGNLVISNAPGFDGKDIVIGDMAANGDLQGDPVTYKGQLTLESTGDILLSYGENGNLGDMALVGRPLGTYYVEQLPVSPTDAQISGTAIGRDVYRIAGGDLTFNGVRLEPLEKRDLDGNLIELQASDVAEWLNSTGETLEPPVVITAATVIVANEPRLNGIAGLTINETVISGPYATESELVFAINSSTALARMGVGASIDAKGKIVLENYSGKDIVISGSGASAQNALGVANGKYKGSLSFVSDGAIKVGFSGDGRPSELANIGMRTGVHIEGAVQEDLLIFVTGEGSGTISGSFDTTMADPAALNQKRLETLRQQDFDVRFTSDSHYQITWTNPSSGVKTVLAERDYDPLIGIDYQGLKLDLNRAPKKGDHFTIDGNEDGIANNENILDIIALERKTVIGGAIGKTLSQAYEETVGKIGNFSSQSLIAQKALEVVNQQAIEARDKVSGVSLDNEAADLIRFQQAYQAAAKTVQVSGELFDTILQASR
jgi:flagellar hook-associated protein FlgK